MPMQYDPKTNQFWMVCSDCGELLVGEHFTDCTYTCEKCFFG